MDCIKSNVKKKAIGETNKQIGAYKSKGITFIQTYDTAHTFHDKIKIPVSFGRFVFRDKMF